MKIKIELDIKDFILLCENTDSEKIYNLNINHREVALKIFEYIRDGASWENFGIIYNFYPNLKNHEIIEIFKEEFRKLNCNDLGQIYCNYFSRKNNFGNFLETIDKNFKDFNILDLKNLLEEFDDKAIEEYVFIKTELNEKIKSETFELNEDIYNIDSEKLEEVVDEYLGTNDPILFRNVMKLLTCVVPSASPTVHRSRERRLKALSKKVEKMHEDMIDIFDEYFPEYAEDLYRLDIYDAEIKAESKHISEMLEKYPNYRHD
jgi:hypothetical protein